MKKSTLKIKGYQLQSVETPQNLHVIAFLLVIWAVCYGTNQDPCMFIIYSVSFFTIQCILCDNAHNPPIGSDARYRFHLHTA